MKQHILVTGAGGFIGKTVVAELLAAGYSVQAMVRPGSIPLFPPHPNLSILWADITDYDSFAHQTKKVDVIVHLAANKYHPKLSWKVNLSGAHNLVRLISEKKVRRNRLINISSQSTKIRFRGVYGESKRKSDEIIENSNIAWTTLKPSLVYGEGTDTLFQTIRRYVEKLPAVPVIGNGAWELYPIAAEDVAHAIINSIERPATIGKIYDLGAPNKITFDELIRLIQKELKVAKPILHIPAIIGLMGVYAATKIIPHFPISIDNVLGSTQNTSCNPRLAIRELGLTLVPIAAGVKKYLHAPESHGVRIAMVGLGKMGIMHSTVLSTIPGAKIVALVDRDETLGATALSMGIQAQFYPSLEEALAAEQIEAVFICTPTFAHKEILRLCLDRRIPFFVEKPVFTQYIDFAATFKPTDKAVLGKSIAGYFWMYKREVALTKELLTKGAIGKVSNYTVTLKHSEVFGVKKGWLFKKALSGGGVLANPGPHAFSLIQYLMGKGKVVSSHLRYIYKNEVEDEAKVELTHSSGVMGTLNASWSVPKHPVMTIEFEIVGTKGKIIYKDTVLTLIQGKKRTVWQYAQIPFHHEVYNLNPKSGGEAYYVEDAQFIAGLTKKKQGGTDLAFAANVEAMINEAYAKAK